MKKLILLIILGSFLFAEVKTAIIKIDGMTCPLCTTAIKRSLKKLDGVIKVKIRLNTKKATVVYNDKKVSKKQLLKSIVNTGYKGKFIFK